jgi:hypothetical protein
MSGSFEGYNVGKVSFGAAHTGCPSCARSTEGRIAIMPPSVSQAASLEGMATPAPVINNSEIARY